MIRFSIITPVHNIAEYIATCISSIISQQFEDFELILIDDGSTDSSGEICDQFSRQDGRIRVIHSNNQGVSAARNLGLNVARGEYVWCVDGDDLLPVFALSRVDEALSRLRAPDILCCAHYDLYPSEPPSLSLLPAKTSSEPVPSCEFLADLYASDGAYWGAGFNIYRRQAFTETALRFDQSLVAAEDCDIFLRLTSEAAACAYLNEPVYIYRRARFGSASTTMAGAAVASQLEVYAQNYRDPPGHCLPIEPIARRFFARKFAIALVPIGGISDRDELNFVLPCALRDLSILRDANGAKYFIARLVWRVLGLRRGSVLIHRIRAGVFL